MTAVKEKAVKIIENMPDNEIIYVLNILENINSLTGIDRAENAAKNNESNRSLMALYGADVDTGFEIPSELDFSSDSLREVL